MENRDKRLQDMGSLIYKVLAGKGFDVTMYDPQLNVTTKPTEADWFWSDEMKMMVNIGQYTGGKNPLPLVRLNKSDVTDPDKFKDVLDTLKSNNVHGFSFDTEPFEGTLQTRHFKNFKESWNWTGSTRSSYLPINQVQVVIRHNRPWDRDALDKAQRWRRIRNIMLHTPDGQRFKFPHNHVCGARAMAQHLNHEKSMVDPEGRLIVNLVKLLQDLQPIQRQCRKRGASHMQAQILETRKKIKKFLEGMCRAETYQQSLDEAKEWSWNWKNSKSTSQQNLEQRQLDEWFEQFEPTRIFENDPNNSPEPVELSPKQKQQVETAYKWGDGDKFKMLDYLKDADVWWKSLWTKNPGAAASTVEREQRRIEKQLPAPKKS